jgi:DNA-damage-inducible protein J
MVHVRMDENIKTQASETLPEMGLTVSGAVRVFLTRVAVEKRMPFELKVPNAETRSAMREADEIIRAGRPRFKNADEMFYELEKKLPQVNEPISR